MKHLKMLLLSALILLAGQLSMAQEQQAPGDELLNNIIPPSPTVAGLVKYAEVPVSLYTGVPSINLPLWNVKSRELGFPISLSYHASGVRVNDLPGWVGSGWSLNCGGVVSRTLRGLPDEKETYGYLDVYNTYGFDQMDLDAASSWDFKMDVAKGRKDTEPDMFSFNFTGRTGQFLLKSDTEVSMLSAEGIYIRPNVEYSPSKYIKSWTVIDEFGTSYLFEDFESTSQVTSTNGSHGISNIYTSAWYLSKIISASGNDIITFEYTTYEEIYDFSLSQEKGYGNGVYCPDYTNSTISTNTSHTLKLKKIYYNDFEVELFATGYREDMAGNSGAVLDSIQIKHKTDVIKELKFTYGYFNQGQDYRSQRLKLLSIQEFGEDGESIPPYVFSYEENIQMPSRISNAQDHWGYYNGQTQNTSLFPLRKTVTGNYVKDANRDANPSYVTMGILKQITYPTGGYSKFEYEGNDYSYINQSPLDPGEFHSTKDMSRTLNLPAGSSAPVQADIDIEFEQDVYMIPNININDTEVNAYLLKFIDIDQYEVIKVFERNSPPQYIYLTEGMYALKVDPFIPTGPPDPDNDPVNLEDASLEINYQISIEGSYVYSKSAGGARIKKITDKTFAGDPGITRSFVYEENNGNEKRSTGVLTSQIFNYRNTKYNYVNISNGPIPVALLCATDIITTTAQYQSAYSQGSHINYYKVTTVYGDETGAYNGKEVTIFSSTLDHPELYHDYAFPYPPVVTCDWRRGKIKEKQVFDTTKQVKKINYQYDETLSYTDTYFPALKIGFATSNSFDSETTDYNDLEYVRYHMGTGWHYLKSEKTSDYYYKGQNTVISETLKEYTYNPVNKMVSTEKLHDSDSTTIETSYSYPFNTPELNSSIATLMDNKHMTGQVIKKETKREIGDSNPAVTKTISRKITHYDKFNNDDNLIYPSLIEIYDTKKVTNTEAVVIDAYDTHGNIRAYHRRNEPPVVILWAYKSQFPVARIDNATLIEVQTALLGIIDMDNLAAQEADHLIEEKIDALKINMPNVQITSFIYNTATGNIKKIKDPNGKKMSYDYDGLGRLEVVKDDEGNIVEKTEYQYQ